jgi:hypothetical protein
MIERLLPFGGIRVEDDVEVTLDGHRTHPRGVRCSNVRGRGRK